MGDLGCVRVGWEHGHTLRKDNVLMVGHGLGRRGGKAGKDRARVRGWRMEEKLCGVWECAGCWYSEVEEAP